MGAVNDKPHLEVMPEGFIILFFAGVKMLSVKVHVATGHWLNYDLSITMASGFNKISGIF